MASFLDLLSLSVLAGSFLISVSCYIIIGAVVNYRKLSQFKGPPLAGFSRLWLFWQAVNARVNTAEFEALEKYGSVCRIGPNLLVTDDTDILKHISAPRSRWTRSGWYEAMKLDPRHDTVFSTRDEKLHADLRAKEAGGYNGRDVDTLESDIDARIIDVIGLIKTTYNGVPMDMANIARYFTLDVLSTVAFGAPFGFLAANSDLWDYNKISASFLFIIELVGNHEFFRWLLSTPLLRSLAAPKKTDKVGMGPMLAFAHKAVAERYGPDPKVKRDMLGNFVSKGMNQVQCEAEASLQIVAGSDSTTTILRATMYLLAGSPVAYGKLKAELEAAVESGDISSPVITYAEAQKLPYLNACIWEGLRMNPPLFGLRSKVAPPGGETIKGIHFPEGTEIAACDGSMCRRKDIFGQDSHIFRPDRWIEASAETRTQYQRTVDLIFGSGRWLCLGRHIAFIELHKALAELVRNFDWAIADPMRGVDTYAHAVHISSNMNLVAWARH